MKFDFINFEWVISVIIVGLLINILSNVIFRFLINRWRKSRNNKLILESKIQKEAEQICEKMKQFPAYREMRLFFNLGSKIFCTFTFLFGWSLLGVVYFADFIVIRIICSLLAIICFGMVGEIMWQYTKLDRAIKIYDKDLSKSVYKDSEE